MKGFKNTTRTKYETGGQVVSPSKPMSSPQQIVDKVNAVAGAGRPPTPTPPAPTQGSGTVRRPTPMPLTKTPIKPGQPKPVPHPTVVNPIRPGRPGRPVINPNPPVKPAGPPMPPAPTGGSTPPPAPRSGYSKGGSAKSKMGKVMHEFATGKLHSGSKKGPEVTNKKQAVAIAMSEARKAGAKMPVKKARGGMMDEGVSSRPTDSSGRRATDAELGLGRAKDAPKKPLAKGTGMMAAALAASKKGVPSYSGKPMIRRKAGGLATMPKGKC